MSRFSPFFLASHLFLSGLFASGCGDEAVDSRFASPYDTFKARQQALAKRDFALLWSCFSDSYRTGVYEGNFETWMREWGQKGDDEIETELRREIAEERLINEHIGYLLFDTSTLESPRSSPFFYFIREADGWKITTFLDSVFHRELEQAIERGEYHLPQD